jgi:aryl-alcohol dehydrogenase-like predicted oxidoreductase
MLDLSRFTFLLGTASWGWNTDRNTAFSLLDSWMQKGFRAVDAAVNYPINKNPADFRAAEKILTEYLQAHGLRDLQITMKIGSVNNLRSPENNLTPSFLLMMAEEYRRIWDNNLACIMIHWDHRNDDASITASLDALKTLRDRYGLRLGLSGIEHPELYRAANAPFGLLFDIQIKHNVLQSGLGHYKPLLETGNRFFAYGINAGGVKLQGPYPADSTFLLRGGQPDATEARLQKIRDWLPEWNLAFVRPPLRAMHQLGLLYAVYTDQIHGAVLGCKNTAQLEETLDYLRDLETFDYSDVYKRLQKL